jgi:PTH1 family peptidyl-tRNA hydrolase
LAQALAVVVGLGNPGPRYADTRHNAGAWFVDRLAARSGATWRRSQRFLGEVAQITGDGELWLLKPETYMNRSGQSVAAMVHYYRHAPEQVLVAHDDLDLPPGTVRLKGGGGHGGHNGLRDILARLGTPEFPRLRFGIGHPGEASQVVGYVLDRPSREDRAAIDAAIDAALQVFARIAAGELQQAMNLLHGRR